MEKHRSDHVPHTAYYSLYGSLIILLILLIYKIIVLLSYPFSALIIALSELEAVVVQMLIKP